MIMTTNVNDLKDYYKDELESLVSRGIVDLKMIFGDESTRAGNSILARRVNGSNFPGKDAYVKFLYTEEKKGTPSIIKRRIYLAKQEIMLSNKFGGRVSPRKLHVERVEGKHGELTLLCLEPFDGTVDELGYRPRRLNNLGIDLANGLNRVHKERCMHRDIKPENVLFKKKKEKRKKSYRYQFSLTDFGLSKGYDDILVDASNNIFAGTWIFISPEYMKAEVYSGPDLERSEIFSYGMTLAVYATRGNTIDFNEKLPKKHNETGVFYEKDKHRKILETSMRRMSKSTKDLIMACLDPKPYNRPQSFSEIVTALG
jgi:serine/threonine protein kinase